MPTYEQLGFGGGAALTGDRARAVFGQVMGLVTVSLGFAALGAYVLRNTAGGSGIIFFIVAFACVFGLQAASARGHEQLAIGLLFAMALFLGMAISPIVVYYANTDSGAVYEAAGSTALFTGALGTFGYATRRDLSRYIKPFLIAFGILFVFGLIAMFVAIPDRTSSTAWACWSSSAGSRCSTSIALPPAGSTSAPCRSRRASSSTSSTSSCCC